MQRIQNYINGEFLPPASGNYFDNYNPATGKPYSRIPDSDERDIDAAVRAAEAAFPSWSMTPVQNRARLLTRIAGLISRDLEKLAQTETTDTGKPISLSRSIDIPRAVSNFEFFAHAVTNFFSESYTSEYMGINYTLRQPIGIVGAISPWNLPLYLFTWKIAPALAVGNCVVAKPSELAPMTAYHLSEICIEAGLPDGVLNIVHGFGNKVGRAISSHPKINAITFTGGTKTGADIASIASPMFKKLSLELGGKNPVLIFSDCDYSKMLETTIHSSFANQGEICLCGSRIFIEKPLYQKFKQDFVERTLQLKIGDPMDEKTQQGALISRQHLEKVSSYIHLAKMEGGKILCGGNQLSLDGDLSGGWFIQPTVIEHLPFDCRTNREEIFGPVVALIPFQSEQDAILMANSTDYGLASVIWTENLSRAHRVASQIKTGIVWINCWMVRDLRTPFGGMKNSGIGREGGFEALRFFTEPKNVCIKV